MQKNQVPELNETYLVEGKRKLQNAGDCHGDNHFCLLSNMMEEETHIVDNISDHEGTGQVLYHFKCMAKLKSSKENQMVQILILHLGENGKTTVQITNFSSEGWKINQGEMVGCLDMRSSEYFYVSKETLQQILQSSIKDNCSFLSERETQEYFDLYHKDHKEVMNYVKSQVNQRLKQQPGNTELVDRHEPDDDNKELSKTRGKRSLSLARCR